MDDIVKAALKKWPNVPDCYEWLGLDARGDWYMRDERTQHAGPFPLSKGSRVQHDKLREFIARNYECDDRGAWFFQNGPQKVYLTLEAAPWVIGVQAIDGDFRFHTHTGLPVTLIREVLLDEQGRLFILSEHGLGVVTSMDMLAASEAVEARDWDVRDVQFADLPGRYGYLLRPAKA